MDKVATIAHSSEQDGGDVANALTTPGSKVSDLDGDARRDRRAGAPERLGRAAPDPPGPLRDENQQVVEALQLRVSGVQGLADTLKATATSKASGDAALLSAQADRLLASDVVWDDLFLDPARSELTRQGVKGVPPPDSNFVANRDLISEHSMSLVLSRLRGASTGGTPVGRPRHEHRRHEGAPERPGADDERREHRHGVAGPGVRGHRP